MARYSFTLENGVCVAAEDATEEFASKQAAVDHAKLVAKDLAQSKPARNRMHVVVRDESGNKVGSIPLRAA
jgi:hypothetical protein